MTFRCHAVSVMVLAAGIAGPLAADTLPEGCGDLLQGRAATLIVPNEPGGGYDTYARAFAPVLADTSGLAVRVENMPAAGGIAARMRLDRAAADEAADRERPFHRAGKSGRWGGCARLDRPAGTGRHPP